METLTAVDDGNIGTSILMRFTDPNNQVDLEIRKLIVVMAQLFRDHNAAPTPEAYLGSTCSSLDLVASTFDVSNPKRPTDVIDAHLTVLSIVIPKAPARFLMSNLQLIVACLRRPLRSKFPFPLDATTCCLGVKCLAHLIIVITKRFNSWSDVSELYSFLLTFATMTGTCLVTDEACSSLHHVLQCFQGTPLLDPASKQIAHLLNKYPPPQQAIQPDICKESQVVQRKVFKAVLALDAVAVLLPVMSTQDRTAVLFYYKTLFELQQGYVTFRIINGVHRVCLNPSPDVSPELLLDLICSICHSVSKHETHYIVKNISELLATGVAKVYSLNRKICETKLPVVFDALKVIMVKPEEEDIAHAAQAFKCLIRACIDESLIKQGVDRILMNANMYNRTNSEPTIIEKLCATIQSLFGYSDTTILYLAFEIVSTMFEKLGVYSSYLMKGTLKTLADMQKLPDQEFRFKEEVKLVLQVVVEKWGRDAIMAVLPQEHMELLAEINEQLGSKSVEARSNVSTATTVRNNQAYDKAPCNNSKREMDDPDIEYEAWNREFREWRARNIAKGAAARRMLGAAAMTKKLKL
ncbi:hypothetical protein RchiOBHm_Chr2g0094991 [Rosa chinensis]|uniref:Uncharacterized protein n=1 Tax=Rosa chinensis TaxID=74649 RepID=A0A2P6RKN5_ROSCH|nr:uncharacterized protein LOC112189198 [Rosa chinensis]PRQ46998.1 hypothetical protein RchiOBHm_Chr2g0094991 [Rosa chinensis]